MKLRLALLCALLCAGASAYANHVSGYVFLMPIGSDTEFRSVGSATYLNDINGQLTDPLQGTHSVSGPGLYPRRERRRVLLLFFGRTDEPGECYSTELFVYVDPWGPQYYDATFHGENTYCATANTPGGGGDLDVCDHCEPGTMEPLVLDLNGDGIWTTSIHDDPVWFDLNGDGRADRTGWTTRDHEDGFLYVDWNGNRTVDGGQELFGDATVLPNGSQAQHGFEALAAYDQADVGGDGDGMITRRDRIWLRRRVWVDRNRGVA